MSLRWILVGCCFAVACADSGDPVDGFGAEAVCGNDVCEIGEDESTCREDCWISCLMEDPGSCEGNTICIDEHCVAMFGRDYIFSVSWGVFPAQDANFAAWDPDGPPDPLVVLVVDGVRFSTPVAPDTREPEWLASSPPMRVNADTTLLVQVFDQDATGNQPAWACEIWMHPDALRWGGWNCRGTGALESGFVLLPIRPN